MKCHTATTPSATIAQQQTASKIGSQTGGAHPAALVFAEIDLLLWPEAVALLVHALLLADTVPLPGGKHAICVSNSDTVETALL